MTETKTKYSLPFLRKIRTQKHTRSQMQNFQFANFTKTQYCLIKNYNPSEEQRKEENIKKLPNYFFKKRCVRKPSKNAENKILGHRFFPMKILLVLRIFLEKRFKRFRSW